MNKILKTAAFFALALFTAACSSDKDFEANSEVAEEVKGIDLEVAITSGGMESRIFWKPVETTKEATPYSWTRGDNIYVIDEKGKCIGKLTCGYSDSGKHLSYFKGSDIKVQNGQRVHLWFFGNTQNFVNADMNVPEEYAINKMAETDIDNTYVDVDLTHQVFESYITYGTSGFVEAQQDVLAKSALVTVANGKATVTDYETKEDIVTMRHLCSMVSVEFETPDDFELKIGSVLKVDGCYSKARFNLVDEKITSSTKNPIYYYFNKVRYKENNVSWAHFLVFPGQSAPEFTVYDGNDHAYYGFLSDEEVKAGIHYMDFSKGYNGNDYSSFDKSFGITVPLTQNAKHSEFLIGEYVIDALGHKVEFGKGNLYAYGNKYPATVVQADEQWIFNPSETVEAGKDNYRWAWLDGDENPKYVYNDYSENNWTTWTNGQIISGSKYDPGMTFKSRAGLGLNREYRMLSTAEWQYLLDHYYWCYAEVEDEENGYNGAKPKGIIIFPIRADDPVNSGDVVRFNKLGLTDIAKIILKHIVHEPGYEDIPTMFRLSGLQFGFGNTSSKTVKIKSEGLKKEILGQSCIFLPSKPGAAFTPYWTSTAAGSGNAYVLQINEAPNVYSGEVGAGFSITTLGAFYKYGCVRLAATVK